MLQKCLHLFFSDTYASGQRLPRGGKALLIVGSPERVGCVRVGGAGGNALRPRNQMEGLGGDAEHRGWSGEVVRTGYPRGREKGARTVPKLFLGKIQNDLWESGGVTRDGTVQKEAESSSILWEVFTRVSIP